MPLESKFQAELRRELEQLYPGCLILKQDANYLQGIPDLLILWDGRWAALECKKSATAAHRPNQDYYIAMMNEMSFAAFVYPENRDEVLDALQQSFRPRRQARISQR